MSEAVEPAPVEARHVRGAERTKTVLLEWPIEYGGLIYDAITLRRPTVAEVRDWSGQMKAVADAGGSAAEVPLPVFAAPAAVIAILDPDDEERLISEARPFLPRTLRGEEET